MISPSSPDPDPSADRVDRGLEAGFGPRATESAAGDSILAVLAQRGGARSRVLLREAPEAGAPLLRPLPAAARERAAAGRYQFQGEIARGGMGVILKGHDQDLGRDVAIKVLHERYKDDASLLRRFVEEAQIGGQLQHPGIVPVYELGVHEGWPFFTMKLIKGRTLGALLAERSEPGQDRRRYLGIFEQVCQTMAYAHARGVIHRDLKPANVMVGAFGEVQVVDWGMAKVLAQGGVADERKERPSTIETVRSRAGTPPGTSSVAGAVMGTPSYMPPEQATGDVERMDERSDVFALGAILCEILTGAPPYAGERDEVLAMAAQGALAAARGRLLQCEVDAELATLVTDCLALAPDERPRNAQALAARVSGYLASAEQRAQQARIEAAEARVNARTEQRARRLGLSLATAVLALVILGGGGWLWLEGQAARRSHDTEQAMTRSLGDAALARGRQDWAAARVALGRAQAHLEAGAPSAELRRQLEGVRIDIEREGEAAATRARMATDNLALSRAFEDVRQPENERSSEWARLDGDYRAIMVARGLDIDGADQQAVAATLAARGIGIELGAAIDDWSLVRQKSGDAAGAMRLSSLAGALDPDPSRQELRAALVAGDTATLRRLAGADIVTTLPATTLRLLGAALGQAGMGEQALTILRAARLRFPRDFALAMRTGHQLLQEKLAAEAGSHFGAALALRPESPEAWRALGRALSAQRQLDRALEVLAFACRTWPDDAHMHFHRAEIWQQKGQIDEAIAALQRATELAPESANAHCNLGRLLHERRDLEAALRHLRRAVDLAPDATALYNLGTALMDVPDLDGAIASLQKAAELAPALSVAHNNLGLALRSRDRLDEAVAAFHKAIAADPKSIPAHVNLGNTLRLKKDLTGAADSLRRALALDSRHASARSDLGLVLQDQHDLAGATACYRQAIDLDPGFAAAHFNLGNALYLQHDLDGAEQSYRTAIRIKDTNANYHRNLGVALKGKGDVDGAGACFRRAAQLGLTTPIVLHAAAWWLVARPGFEPADAREAVGYARKAAEQQPTGAVLHTLGVALYRAGDLQECVTIMERAREAPESSPAVVALFLAMARHRLGQREAARQLFDSVAPIFAEGNVTEEPWRFRAEAAQVLGLGPSKVEATAPRSRPAESRTGGRR